MDDGHNFIAFKATADAGSTITVELIGGKSGPKTLDEDGIVVMQLVEGGTAVELVATKSGVTDKKRFILGITKEAES